MSYPVSNAGHILIMNYNARLLQAPVVLFHANGQQNITSGTEGLILATCPGMKIHKSGPISSSIEFIFTSFLKLIIPIISLPAMMLFRTTFLSLSLWTLCVLAQSLQQALRDNGHIRFADFLASDPPFELDPTASSAFILAPIDAAFDDQPNGILGRRAALQKDSAEYYTGENGNARRGLLTPDETVVETFFTNPQYVNLNGRGQVFIRQPTLLGLFERISSGLQESVNIVSGDIPFDQGTIRAIDGFLTVPESISTTIAKIGFGPFTEFLESTGILSMINGMPTLTLLIPTNFAPPSPDQFDEFIQIMQQHVLIDFPGYTSMLEDGQSYRTLAGPGKDVTVQIRGDSYFINGARIVQANIIVGNGAIHVLDRMVNAPPGQLPLS
ncbi:uncharacterized protein BDCG_06710 [Blastomyces dermatitidis ER-3]|uniref:FAS1 domain-containing protein n=2 Tax=Blastomyces TaxID=229219 RepID=A0A179UNV9_BLAGS|nr:uncharacterized protein BDBG_05280 [Blastomyces gilchristii SLH14081]XP_045278099.1 uncharacterized protein BDCG_06710 [Blastomyces dermatitidis ER-3]EEQ91590.2 hypothetical protein BDCG_06710 [Blastomyces dermatitidis ER-3]EQL33867.1 hypothetical protein BDFG_04248 [Blastomyces dermatitidis ATCC 26199]OAT09520.1 hypothetical protein BDBG_05280 [Blastomyces gilchristii SLH14081]